MTKFWSCHLIVDKNSLMILNMFVTSQMLIIFIVKVFLLYFLDELRPKTLTFTFAITLVWGNITYLYH